MPSALPNSPSVDSLPGGFSSALELSGFYDIVPFIFLILFAIWAIYTVVSIYHWVRYSRNSWLAAPSIAVHIVVSIALMFYATAGLH